MLTRTLLTRNLKAGIVATCRATLCLVAILAVGGLFWRSPTTPAPSVPAGLLLSLWTVILLVLEKSLSPSRPRNRPETPMIDTSPELEEELEREIDEESEFFDEGATQQIVRSRTADGRDRLEGTFLLEYLDDQLTATVHVPFCPPFETAPEMETFLLEEVDAKTTVVKLQPFGARIDVKRANLSQPSRFHLVVTAEG